MRILHVSWEFPPVMYGGLGRHVHALSAAQAAAGHDVCVLTQHDDNTVDRETFDGVRVVRVRESGSAQARTIDNLIPWVTSMQEAMATLGAALADDWIPDVVHAHDWVVGDCATVIADRARVPLVATVHATEAGRHGGWIVGALSHQVHEREWALAHRADTLIVCSEAMRAEVNSAFTPNVDVRVVPNGVDLAEWRVSSAERNQARIQAGIRDGHPLIVFSGRLVWEKGVDTLIEALPHVLAQCSTARLSIAGRGPLLDELTTLARGNEALSAIDFCGFLPESQLRQRVAAATCAVIPSRYEPFGLVAVEACALGTPVVASNVGGLREIIIDNVTGLLVPAGDPVALANAIVNVITDPAGAGARVDAAHERVAEHFTWPVIAQRTVELYRNTSRAVHRRESAPLLPDMNVFTNERVTQ